MPNTKNLKRYYMRDRKIPSLILSTIGNKEIIHGTTALNAHLPKWLDRQTDDIDVFSSTPKKDARQAERLLDRQFGFDAFALKPALHEGTTKVYSKVTGRGLADFTKPDKRPPSKKIKGKRYVTLSYINKTAKKTLKDKESAFRHAKDKDSIQRIKTFRKFNKNTRKKKK